MYLPQYTLQYIVFLYLEQSSGGQSSNTPTSNSGETMPIRAPASLWRCSRIMHLLRDLHPTLLSALEGIVDQVSIQCRITIGTFLK